MRRTTPFWAAVALAAVALACATQASRSGDGGNAGSGGGGPALAGRAGGGGGGGAAGASGGAPAATGGGGKSGSGGLVSGSGGTTVTGDAATNGAAGGTASGGAGGASGGSGNAFKGLAGGTCADLTQLQAGWFYNWTVDPGGCTAQEFVPMIGGKAEKTPAAVAAAVTQIANAGYKTVLGFNEPNKADQSNLTVAEVLALWPSLTSNAGLRVGSPATSGDAQAWFTEFMTEAAARNLRVDFIALHWYGWNAGSCDRNAATLESYIKWAEGIPGNRPIWLTEWGCLNASNPDAATVQAFFKGALAMFQRHPRIERYAWYQFEHNNELVSPNGGLTPLGSDFANAPVTR